MKKLLLIGIFLWGVALRAVEVISGNYLFGFDVGRDLLVARSIVEAHKFTLIGAEIGSGVAGINGIFQGPGYYYLLAFVYWLFRGNPYGALLTMFVFGVAALAAVYWTVKRMFGRATAAVSLFLAAVSPLLVSQSRFIWAPHPASVLIVLFFYFVFSIPKNPRLFTALAVLAAGLTYHFEFAMTVPLLLALGIAVPAVYRVKDGRTYAYAFAAALFVFAPLILFEMRHGWIAVRSILSYMSPTGVVGRDVWWLRITDHVRPYLSNAANSFITERGFLPQELFTVLSVGLFIGLIIAAVRVRRDAERKFFQFLVLVLVTSYVAFLFLNNVIWDYYLIHAHFIYIYAFAYFLVHCARSMKKSPVWKIPFAALIIFLSSMVVSSARRMWVDYTYDFRDFGGVEKILGKKTAIDYVYRDAGGKPFSVFVFMAPVYTYPYDYLFATYGRQTYGYEPGREKKGLVYLIIEPDASKPWTYKGWLETVIVGGDIIETKTLPTGHIIQKRMFGL